MEAKRDKVHRRVCFWRFGVHTVSLVHDCQGQQGVKTMKRLFRLARPGSYAFASNRHQRKLGTLLFPQQKKLNEKTITDLIRRSVNAIR